MNLGQILLIILALWLLATIQLTINSSITRASLVTMDSEARIDAISVGQAMIDEIQSKSFDSCAVNDTIYFLNKLTPSSKFGPDRTIEKTVLANDKEPFKSMILFNDVDDYHRYTRIVTPTHLGEFFVRDSIIYVRANDQNVYSATPTWYKKIIVVVKHPNLVDSVVIKSLKVYREYF
ncbi:MAG: hypothetical protein QME52_06005 [Bacteroidota bacterium]|nr:hypothetical protein [Bacteroidota bacterium]